MVMLRFPADSVWDAVQSSASAPAPSSRAHTVTPAHAASPANAHMHCHTCPRILSLGCRYTRHTYTRTHLFSVSVAAHAVRLQLVLAPLRALVAGFSTNIIPLVWTGLNRSVCARSSVFMGACMPVPVCVGDACCDCVI